MPTKPPMGRRPLPADQKKHPYTVFLTKADKARADKHFGSLAQIITVALNQIEKIWKSKKKITHGC